ncbi:MAG TPA: MEDS domain-containing protein [Candidatus Dormibacteraeota bacterium]|nr:MEDS domain-containing protein [Candidatus Dormibacteraeota bacterium]
MAEAAADEVTLGWNSDTLPTGSHVCFYYLNEEMLKRTLAFLRVGLDAPTDFCVLFADENRSGRLLSWLGEGYHGEIQPLIDCGKLAVIGGAPTVDELLMAIGARLDRAVKDGYQLIRFLGFIGWGQPGWPNDRDLLEFEAKVNYAVTAYPAVIICTYGVPSLPGTSLIYGGLQTHPVTILGDVTDSRNRHYLPPAKFVEGLPRP